MRRLGLATVGLILVAALAGCATSASPSRSPAAGDGGEWIALPREAPAGRLVAWVRGPYVFVMRYDDVLASLDAVSDVDRHAAIRDALQASENATGADALFLNPLIGDSPQLAAAFGPVLADLLTGRRASLIDTERGFVIGSVQEVPVATRAARYRTFQTRDGREVLRVADQPWVGGIPL